jgi:hypothetical protein
MIHCAILSFYKLSLYALPTEFRPDFGAEMVALFQEVLKRAAQLLLQFAFASRFHPVPPGRSAAGNPLALDAIALGDAIGDGLVDIFVAGVDFYQVWRGLGDGRFTADARTNHR